MGNSYIREVGCVRTQRFHGDTSEGDHPVGNLGRGAGPERLHQCASPALAAAHPRTIRVVWAWCMHSSGSVATPRPCIRHPAGLHCIAQHNAASQQDNTPTPLCCTRSWRREQVIGEPSYAFELNAWLLNGAHPRNAQDGGVCCWSSLFAVMCGDLCGTHAGDPSHPTSLHPRPCMSFWHLLLHARHIRSERLAPVIQSCPSLLSSSCSE